MALRAGYYGFKNAIKRKLEKLAVDTEDMKIIKSFGDGFDLSDAGELDLIAASASDIGGIKVGAGLSISSDGVLSASGGAGGIVLDSSTAIECAVNTPVTVEEGKIYLFVGDNGVSVTGGTIIAGNPATYIMVGTVGFTYLIIKAAGNSMTFNKVGALLPMEGADDKHTYSFSAVKTGTTLADIKGAVYWAMLNGTTMTSDDVNFYCKDTFAMFTSNYTFGLFDIIEDSPQFNTSVYAMRIMATRDDLVQNVSDATRVTKKTTRSKKTTKEV